MNIPVRVARAGTTFISILSFSISYIALTDLARQSGLGELQSYAWPLVVDGTSVVATVAVVAMPRAAYPWFLLVCGTAVSLAGNGIHAWTATHSAVAVGVALVPPLALLAVTHLTVQLGRAPDTSRKADQQEQPETSDVADAFQIDARPVATRDIALQLIAEGDMSLRGIGEHLGVSDTTIRRWRDAAAETTDQSMNEPLSLVAGRSKHMKRTLIALAAGALLLGGCSASSDETGTPTVTGPDASIVATVDCGGDGVANVRSAYGTGEAREQLIGRNSTTSGAGGSKTYSSNFGTKSGMGASTLSITTSPTKGTCTTTLTDYNGGDVLVQKETSGEVTVEAVIDSGD